jgi:DNA-binding HxlR family transcriptional regulator
MQALPYDETVLGKTYEREVCSMARALEVVGERWSLLIVRDALFAGVTRFSDFQRSLGVAPNVLAARLDAFVSAGVMERRRYSGQPEQHDYVLTAKGRDLASSIIALTRWGDRWAACGEPPILYTHAGCDGAVGAETVCARCGAVDHDAVRAEPGPGMPEGYVEDRRRGVAHRPRRPGPGAAGS